MNGFSNILFVAGQNADDPAAFSQALLLAKNNQAQITVVGVVDAPETHRLSAQAYESFLRSPSSGTSNTEVDTMVQEEEQKRSSWSQALVDKHCAKSGEEAVNYLKPQLHLVNGDAGKVVPTLSDDLSAELVVMGTVGRAGIPGMLIGNTAESILNQIDCSVLTVKPAGFVSPITLNE